MAKPTVQQLDERIAELTTQVEALRQAGQQPAPPPPVPARPSPSGSDPDAEPLRSDFGYMMLTDLLGRTTQDLFVGVERTRIAAATGSTRIQVLVLAFAPTTTAASHVELLARGATKPELLPISGTDRNLVEIGDKINATDWIDSVLALNKEGHVVAIGPRLAPLQQAATTRST